MTRSDWQAFQFACFALAVIAGFIAWIWMTRPSFLRKRRPKPVPLGRRYFRDKK
jgi:hypothetical protein